MGTGLRWVGIRLAVPLLVLCLTGCASKTPGSADVTESLQQSLAGYALSDLECESFADGSQEGAGRTSCRGSIAPAQDLYSPLPAEEVQSLLVSAGIPKEGAVFFANRHPQQIFKLSVKQGTTTPLTADCNYLRNVDGWQLAAVTLTMNLQGSPLLPWALTLLCRIPPNINRTLMTF